MPTSDAPGADEAPVETSQETRPAEPLAAPTIPTPLDPPRPDPPGVAHIHQYVRVHVEETVDSFVVTRTETVLGHRHGPDLEDAGERRLARPPARRARGRREWGAPGGPDSHGAGEFVSFGSKSRMPAHLTRAQVDAYLKQERRLALDVRDPVAINFAAERYNTIMSL